MCPLKFSSEIVKDFTEFHLIRFRFTTSTYSYILYTSTCTVHIQFNLKWYYIRWSIGTICGYIRFYEEIDSIQIVNRIHFIHVYTHTLCICSILLDWIEAINLFCELIYSWITALFITKKNIYIQKYMHPKSTIANVSFSILMHMHSNGRRTRENIYAIVELCLPTKSWNHRNKRKKLRIVFAVIIC